MEQLCKHTTISAQARAALAFGLATPFPADCADMTPCSAGKLANQYLAHIDSFGDSALRVVDKMPANSLLLGLAAAVLPGAHFVYVRRHAIDTCWSIYKRDFSDSHGYSHDMENLGG